MPTGRHRLFVALFPSEPARAALASLAEGLARARWTPPEQLHLTPRFIGDVTDEELSLVREALAAVRIAPFPLGVEGVGRFPPRGQPAVVWSGVGAAHPFLLRLRQQVDDRLLATGVPFELTPFVPHFTIGRVRDSSPAAVEQWLKRHRDFAGPIWRAEAFYLMASTPGPSGAVHRIVETFPLRAAPGPLV
jgi:RNA 2',3'-cyclic 3'-phosphodiesterase